jgi:hypothetical protein
VEAGAATFAGWADVVFGSSLTALEAAVTCGDDAIEADELDAGVGAGLLTTGPPNPTSKSSSSIWSAAGTTFTTTP